MKKTTWVIIVLIALVLVVGGFFWSRGFYGITSDGSSVPPAGAITIRGDLVCLTKKPPEGVTNGLQVSTLECIIGLKDKGGHQYGLNHFNSAAQVGATVTVSGTLVPGKVSYAPDGQIYDTVGDIDVSSVR